MSLIVSICTNRTPSAVAPALGAACRQAADAGGASVLLVTSGLDPAAHAAHAEAAERRGADVASAGAGLSVARNRALERAADCDVLAFLDDDALPEEGWLAALAARWREAPDAIACIGGAITPSWEAPPPAWVSERIAGAFSLLDLGPGVVELDPGQGRDAWGANVSFRVGPLREVGGFSASRGPWADVPLFGDESAVQRRLAERGFRVIYAGDVRVSHRVGAERLRLAGLWRRELYRGAGAAIDGRDSPGAAARRAVKATAGLMVALARRDRPLAGERFARLARCVGAAMSPLIRRRLRSRGWPEG